jgi:hypothetical protein
MILLDIVAENISDYDLPGLPAIAVIKLDPGICVIVHKVFRYNNLEVALSFLHNNGDNQYHFTLLSEVGESWAAPCIKFAQEIPMTHRLLDEEPWAIEFVAEPLKFWYRVDDLGYEYAIVH